ncbi:N-acetylmuramoyl-L-alanine amidase [Mucilaginibacter sp. PAMB04274]|uniref:N-acetylmuramoyl-L-alanine amidase n=1 Tax=Mucilaginibacter sp. PAMB04274 TaxID=3138568 RepID=UPI0031F66911
MKIIDHLLVNDDDTPVTFKATPNHGGIYTPQYLVMHYTAATTTLSTVSWFQSTLAKASAHLLIARDGTVTQFAPFNVITWHAGKSQWKGLVGLNQFSIGIEMVNGGRLTKSIGKWICPVDAKRVPDDEVVIAIHKNESSKAAWHDYTEKQLKAAIEISALLVKTYNLKDVVGHEDIAPIRKSDPGPAFPMASFKSKVMGRETDFDEDFVTSADVNIRAGAGTAFATVAPPVPGGTPVRVLKTNANWSFVEVLKSVNGIMDLEGWIASRFIVLEQGVNS